MIAQTAENTNNQAKNALQEHPLGNIALSSSISIISDKQKTRQSAYKLLSSAQKILIENNVTSPRTNKPHRTRICHACRTYQADAVTIKLNGNDINSEASIGNVQTCGSVWSCPICAKRIAVEKGKLVQKALIFAEENNLVPVMVTLTAEHELLTPLKEFKKAFKSAWVSFSSRRRWRNFKGTYGLKHYIANSEITHGRSGWHYHKHILLFLDAVTLKYADANISLEKTLRKLWLDCLVQNDLDGVGEYALKVSAHENVSSDYLTKIGLTEDSKTGDLQYELTASSQKKSGRTIWDILRHASYGDKQAELLYLEFVDAMFGDSFISFSDGFLPLLEDIELPSDDNQPEKMRTWIEISPYWWRLVYRWHKIADLLEISARTRDIEQVREYLFDLQEELIEEKKMAEFHRIFRVIPNSSEDNIIVLREASPCSTLL